MNNSINLLDYKNKIQPNNSHIRYKYIRLTAIGLLFIVSVSSLIFFLLVAISPLPELRKKELSASLVLNSSRDKIIKLLHVRERATTIGELINKRNYFDKILTKIQAILPAGVRIKSEELSEDRYNITFSSDSLQKFDIFLDNLTNLNNKDHIFSQMSINDFSTNDAKNGFTLTLSLHTI